MTGRTHRSILIALIACHATAAAADDATFTPEHVAALRTVTSAVISPDGTHVAYTLSVPRTPFKDDDGPAYVELHVVDLDGRSRPFVSGQVNVSDIAWTPDGAAISFLAKRGDDEHKSLYVIPDDGGEARRVLTADEDISAYDWHPAGKRIAYLATEPQDKHRKKQSDSGFSQEVFEEELRPVRVWIADVDPIAVTEPRVAGIDDTEPDPKPRMLDLAGSASAPRWNPDGTRLLVALAATPFVDDALMRRRYHVVDVDGEQPPAAIETRGKIGRAAWSPDGRHVALIAARDEHDPAAGRLMVAPATGGEPTELLADFEGHFRDLAWQANDTVMFVAHQGVNATFGKTVVRPELQMTSIASGGPILRSLSLRDDRQGGVFLADTPVHPREVYYMQHGDDNPRRLTDSNPWLARVRFAPQEPIEYKARDGTRLEGILIHPLDEQTGRLYPLILGVHGGPEQHISNGWVTNYVYPGQVAAARGYAVFLPNYRGSTGRGVEFSQLGQGDYGGKEFDDLVDAADHLIETGLVDRNKVGVTGGSYGGYATAWCATKLTDHFAAAVMYMGISDQVSKFGTTDIPNEMHLVHARKWPWKEWDWFRERSPIRYAEQSRTPLLILHGKADTRVHPSQSLELHRYLKTLGKTVRLVLYPGEGHGNRRAASRYDYHLRMLRWFDHYLQGPGGEPPPVELDYPLADATADADEPATAVDDSPQDE